MEEGFKVSHKKSSKVRNDNAVQGTNDSSILSKISAAQVGYFDDDFLKYFGSKIIRRSTLVNRGYYIRARLIDFMINEFLSKVSELNTNNQIVNLGAGFDSTFFRLRNSNQLDKTLFIEIDFPDVINRKYNLIKIKPELNSLCPDLAKVKDVNGNIVYECRTSNYILIGIDMRNSKLLEVLLRAINGFSDTDPTFLLSEVVLTYMAVNSSNSLIKWIGEVFQNCVLTIYEQINPYDGFGQVMCSHFKKLGSPLKCILKYPFEEDQINRYRNLGFNDCFSMKASDFLTKVITHEEKSRLDRLELFDEYEPWNLKCSHYALVTATRGGYFTEIFSNIYKSILESLPANLIPENKSIISVKEFPVKLGVRFGHFICQFKNKVFVFGGFGENITDTSGKHMRLIPIEFVDLNTFKLSIFLEKEPLIGGRIFQAGCVTLDDESIIVSYGRSNPSKIFDSIVKMNIVNNNTDDNLNSINVELIDLPQDSLPVSRFRHSMSALPDKNIFIYGGKTFDEASSSSLILNDAFLINYEKKTVKSIQLDDSVCKARHSHTLSKWNNYLIIAGGLDKNEEPLDDIILVDYEDNFKPRKLNLNKGKFGPRYSHTAHIIDDTLILIGGANNSIRPPGICFIDLKKLKCSEFELPVSFNLNNADQPTPLIFICHQTCLLDKNTVLLIGGGSICFTFGTHLNKQALLLDISSCWSKLED